MGFSIKLPSVKLPNLPIKVSAPKLPNISVPKALDPSRAIKGTLATVARSDIGVLSTGIGKGLTGQKLSARENKAVQTGAKVGAIAAGGYLIATQTGIAGSLASKLSAAKAYVVANPLTSAAAASKISQGNIKGAASQVGLSQKDLGIPDVKLPNLPINVQGNVDTMPNLMIANSPGVKPTLQNTSTQPPLVVAKSSSENASFLTPPGGNNKTIIFAGVGLVLSLLILKKMKII